MAQGRPGVSADCLGVPSTAGKFVIADTTTEQRWARWCQQVRQLGILSVLSIRLVTEISKVASLNLYANATDRFGNADDVAVGQILRSTPRSRWTTPVRSTPWSKPSTAGPSSDRHILMERYDLDADQAFAVSRRYSQLRNMQLSEVARKLTAARELPE
jgi:hypothetical protein